MSAIVGTELAADGTIRDRSSRRSGLVRRREGKLRVRVGVRVRNLDGRAVECPDVRRASRLGVGIVVPDARRRTEVLHGGIVMVSPARDEVRNGRARAHLGDPAALHRVRRSEQRRAVGGERSARQSRSKRERGERKECEVDHVGWTDKQTRSKVRTGRARPRKTSFWTRASEGSDTTSVG